MPVATPSAVRQQIESGRPDLVYLLQGEDEVEKSALAAEFHALVDEGLQAFNVERLHAGEMTSGDKIAAGVGSILAASRTLPMMSAWRIIVVPQAEGLFAPDAKVRPRRARSPRSRRTCRPPRCRRCSSLSRHLWTSAAASTRC